MLLNGFLASIMLYVSLLTLMLPVCRDVTFDRRRRANKGQNKGSSRVMIMQLAADSSHEYGNCEADSLCVRCMHKAALGACVTLSVNTVCPHVVSNATHIIDFHGL